MWVVSLKFEGVVGGGGARQRDVGGVEWIKGRISAMDGMVVKMPRGVVYTTLGPVLPAGRPGI